MSNLNFISSSKKYLKLPIHLHITHPVLCSNRLLSNMPKITSEKHLRSGSTCPPTEKDLLRFYNMKWCPYAQRTLLVLHAKGIKDFELVNVHLKHKPDWFLKKNPLGKVPVLELNGEIIFESLVSSDYLDTVYPDPPLYPRDPYKKYVDKSLAAMFDPKVVINITKMYFRQDLPQKFPDWIQRANEGFQLYEAELKNRGSVFFGGSKPGMLDYMIWPWFERLPVVERLMGNTFLPEKDFPRLTRYCQEMLNDKAVKATILPVEKQYQFILTLINGDPDYDMDRYTSKL